MGGSASRRGQCFQRGALRSARQPEALHQPTSKSRKRFPWLRPDRGFSQPERGSASFPSGLKRAKRSGSDGQQIGKASFLKIRKGRSASFSRAAKRKKRFVLTGSPARSASLERVFWEGSASAPTTGCFYPNRTGQNEGNAAPTKSQAIGPKRFGSGDQ